MKTKLNLLMIVSLLFGLVFSSPAQTVSAATATDIAYFQFNSFPNPSDYGLAVTFTLSATGSDPVFLPSGYVDFYAGETLICDDVPLNNPQNTGPGNPATCSVSTLAAGNHEITAEFTSDYQTMYASETITLAGGQTVGEPPTVTISPETLPDVKNDMYIVQTLTPDWNGFLTYEIIAGALPPGIALVTYYFENESKYIGELNGWLNATDTFTFTFTVGAYDSNHLLLGSREYTWNVLTPFMSIGPDTIAAAIYQTPYSQQLTVNGGFAPYTFSLLNGILPNGITLSSEGVLSGYASGWADTGPKPGSFPITVRAQDINDNSADRNYTLVLDKGTPAIEIYSSIIYWNRPFNLSAVVKMPDPSGGATLLDGTVDFSVDGLSVLNCQDVPSTGSYYPCSGAFMDLSVGMHTVEVSYTPTGWYADYYNPVTASAEITVQPSYFYINGTFFEDKNQNKVRDEGEPGLENWTVNLDQGCDGTSDGSTLTSGTGWYQLNAEGGYWYCITAAAEPGYQQTTADIESFWLDRETFEKNIGFYYPTITLSPDNLLNGTVGLEYSQVLTANGGTGPYTYTISTFHGEWPDGLSLSPDGILSGTPGRAGTYYFTVMAEDASHAAGYQWYSLDIANVLIDGVFEFTSSANPSFEGETVIFTLSATGGAALPPVGFVSFLADGTEIEGCSDLYLNLVFDPDPNIDNKPATCTTTALAVGSHEIVAVYTDLTDLYNDATLILSGGQTINSTAVVTITPDTLQDSVYGIYSTHQLIAANAGVESWSITGGALPLGVTLTNLVSSGEYVGNLYGAPEEAGSFTFTVGAFDSDGSLLATKEYTWHIEKAIPKVTFVQVMTYNQNTPPYNKVTGLYVNVDYTTYSPSIPQPSGTVSITVGGTALTDCTGLTSTSQTYSCTTDALVKLAPGSYTLRAEFSPDGSSAPNYNNASKEYMYTVLPRVEGLLFNDLNKNGTRGEGEEPLGGHVYLDHNCDGSNEYNTPNSTATGLFSLEVVSGEYCLSIFMGGNWRSTTALPMQFTVEANANQYFEIGFYDTIINIGPETLPDATMGVPYSQEIVISGGTGPYIVTISEESILPEGITFDEATFTLSGTPTKAGYNHLDLVVTDAEGMKGFWYSPFHVFAEGTFTLESSNKLSTFGEVVTFTFSGSGDVIIPEYNTVDPVQPFGMVAFYIGDSTTPIDGCGEVVLNYDLENDIPTVKPAVCITSALAEGSHDIKAVFSSSWLYLDATRFMTQTVQVPVTISADLSITKIDKTDPVKRGTKLDYILTVSNAGPDAAQNLTLKDTLDRNTTYVSTSAPKDWTCKYANYQVTCTSSSLASGSSAVIKITVTVNKTAKVGKDLVNNASISSETFDPDLLNNSVIEKTLVLK
jgi:large repetitive protein